VFSGPSDTTKNKGCVVLVSIEQRAEVHFLRRIHALRAEQMRGAAGIVDAAGQSADRGTGAWQALRLAQTEL
jgi:hypothetical protein